MKTQLFFYLFLFSISAIFAQDYQVSGVVSYAKDLPAVGVQVRATQQSKTVVTNYYGTYKLLLPKGVHSLEFSATGYETKTVQINLTQDMQYDLMLPTRTHSLEEVLVRGVRVDADSPITHSNMSQEDLAQRNLGQDLPIMMNYLPSVVTTTDAGAGVGYTGIRVRGTDPTRINVTLNGIPYNDAESQGSFWVNMPDITSSVQDLQLQRGVGTSTNGSGAFGASINLQTDALSTDAYASVANSYGSFNTWKHTLKFSTGLLNDHFEVSGRLSKIKSDGYIDRAFSDLKSYYLQAAYITDNSLVKAILFGGNQETYQAWNGVDAETMKTDRKFNSAGMYYDANGNIKFYENEIDSYKQNHYQLHWNQRIDHEWSTNLSLNYTKGLGYFEQYKDDDKFATYGMTPYEVNGELIDRTDIIRRRWLDNNYIVLSSNVNYKNEDWDITAGGFYSNYTGDHYGEIIWAEHAAGTSKGDVYYFSDAKKTEATFFAKATYTISDKWKAFADLQGRFVDYQTKGKSSSLDALDIKKSFSFFNPKAGVSYQASELNQFYLSYAKAHREPNRQDFEEDIVDAEVLNDWELGWRYTGENFKLSSNLYYMHYQNQLVLTGDLDDVGRPMRTTSGKSYRAGLEIDSELSLSSKFTWFANATFSQNKNKDFVADWNGELTNFGDTDLSFSPSIIASSMLVYQPLANLNFGFLSKYVGEQYMGNLGTKASKLEDYLVHDLQVNYVLKPKQFAKSITFSLLVNNLFNKDYSSNGFYYTFEDDYTNPGQINTVEGTGYYPQAGTNFLMGVNILF